LTDISIGLRLFGDAFPRDQIASVNADHSELFVVFPPILFEEPPMPGEDWVANGGRDPVADAGGQSAVDADR
jgi:hypothetical protein